MIKTRNTEKTRDLSMKNGETVELNTKNLENMVVCDQQKWTSHQPKGHNQDLHYKDGSFTYDNKQMRY